MFRTEFDTAEEYELADMLHSEDVQVLVRLQLQQMRDEAAEYGETIDDNFSDYVEAFDRVMEGITAILQQERKDRAEGYDDAIDRSSSASVAMAIASHILQGNPEALDIVEEELLENASRRERQPGSRGRYAEVELQRREKAAFQAHPRGF